MRKKYKKNIHQNFHLVGEVTVQKNTKIQETAKIAKIFTFKKSSRLQIGLWNVYIAHHSSPTYALTGKKYKKILSQNFEFVAG